MKVAGYTDGVFTMEIRGQLSEGRRLHGVLKRALAELAFDRIDTAIIKDIMLALPAGLDQEGEESEQ